MPPSRTSSSDAIGNRHLTVNLLSLVVLAACGLAACATTQGVAGDAAISSADIDSVRLDSQQRLRETIAEREHDSFSSEFGIGPGDVLEISVAGVDEVKQRIARVSPQGTIELPIAGSLEVNGLTEPQLNAALTKAFSKYIKDPEVNVFVQSYNSRQVAVVGMVNKPGRYTLNRRGETILDLIGRAGGMSGDGGSLIIFVPATDDKNATVPDKTLAELQPPHKPRSDAGIVAAMAPGPDTQVTAEQPDTKAAANWPAAGGALPDALATGSDSIFINLAGGSQRELSVPLRPGDVIIVPARGQVLVQGWVQNPGAYPITPGMTALGAITAAGGQMFSSSALVLRAGSHGERIRVPVDLSRVESGQSPDIQVQSGDVVIVEHSVAGALPYGLYFLLNKFGSGMMMSMLPAL
jgi:protein involved in polysaccharide export with SLBB domain/predicted small secreted protein